MEGTAEKHWQLKNFSPTKKTLAAVASEKPNAVYTLFNTSNSIVL